MLTKKLKATLLTRDQRLATPDGHVDGIWVELF